MAKKELEEMTARELVAVFNQHILLVGGVGARPVVRFASKADGLKRVRRLLAQHAVQKKDPEYTPVHPKQQVRAAQAIRSWRDPAVRSARVARHYVTVNGVDYSSVANAFRKLGLPMGRHIQFRVALANSAKGKLDFVCDRGTYAFRIKK